MVTYLISEPKEWVEEWGEVNTTYNTIQLVALCQLRNHHAMFNTFNFNLDVLLIPLSDKISPFILFSLINFCVQAPDQSQPLHATGTCQHHWQQFSGKSLFFHLSCSVCRSHNQTVTQWAAVHHGKPCSSAVAIPVVTVSHHFSFFSHSGIVCSMAMAQLAAQHDSGISGSSAPQ